MNRKPKDELEDREVEAEPKKVSLKDRAPRQGKAVKEEKTNAKAAMTSLPVKKPARKVRKKATAKQEDEAVEEAHEEPLLPPAKNPSRKPCSKNAVKTEDVVDAETEAPRHLQTQPRHSE